MLVGALAGKLPLFVCQLIPRAPQCPPQRCFICLKIDQSKPPGPIEALAGEPHFRVARLGCRQADMRDGAMHDGDMHDGDMHDGDMPRSRTIK